MDFGAQSLSALFPDCLHLRSIVTFASPKLATNDAATSYWMRFPLINLYTLLGVPLVPPIHNQGVSSAPNQGHTPYGDYSCRLLAHSLYVLLLTFFLQQHFSVDVFLLHSDFYISSYRGWSEHSSILFSNAQTNHDILFSTIFMLPL